MRGIFALILCLFSLIAKADHAWSFVRVQEDMGPRIPQWRTSIGQADVEIQDGKIRISAFDVLGDKEPSIILEGTIDKSGNIKAKGVLTHTDAYPFSISGKMHTHTFQENWAGTYKSVTKKEIIFPLYPHYEFYGFITKEVNEQK